MQDIKAMNQQELEYLEEAIKNELIERIYQELLNKKVAEKYVDSKGKFICHYCSGTRTHKAGLTPQKKQRYKCVDCNKHMIAGRSHLTFSSKKKFKQWVLFIESLLNGDNLKVSADKADISQATAFRWRHKVFYIMNDKMNQTVLVDEIFLDETVYPNITKNPRAEKEHKPKKRGMSDQKVNVTCAIDSTGNTVIKVSDVGRITSQSLIDIYEKRIQSKSLLISDSHRSYHKLMNHLDVIWVKIPTKKKSLGEYTLDKINHLHGSLKDFTSKYKGISIKYLQGYCAFFDYMRKREHFYQKACFFDIIVDLFSTKGHLKCSKIDTNSVIYN